MLSLIEILVLDKILNLFCHCKDKICKVRNKILILITLNVYGK